jgi:hypothetical protein
MTLRVPRGLVQALAAPGLLLPALFPGVVFRARVFFLRDIHLIWYGQMRSLARVVRDGSWPLWDPFASFGSVMLANANNQAFYPTTWLTFLLGPPAGFVLYVLVHCLLGGAGVYVLARALGLGGEGGTVASAVWLASGPVLSSVNLWNHFAGLAWMPWVLWAARRLGSDPGQGSALALSATLGLQMLTGSPDLSLFSLILAVPLALGAPSPEGSSSARRLGWFLVSLAAAAGLSAAQWVPSFDAARAATRETMATATGAVGALHPLGGALKLALPVAAWDLPLRHEFGAILLDGGVPLLSSLYLGVAATGLALRGALARRPWRGVLVAAAAVSVVMAMGPHTPLAGLAEAAVPFLGWLRYPEKAVLVTGLAWSLLAGMGYEAWSHATARRGERAVLAALCVLTALEGAAAIALHAPGRWLPAVLVPERDLGATWFDALSRPREKLVLAALLGLAALLVATALVRGRSRRRELARLLALVAVVDLCLAGRDLNPTAPRSFYAFRSPLVDALDQRDGSRLFVWSYQSRQPRTVPPFDPGRVAWFPNGFSLVSGRALGTRLYGTPPSGASWGWWSSFDPDVVGLLPRATAQMTGWLYDAEGTPAFRRLLRIGAVSRAAALHPLDPAGLRLLDRLATLRERPTLLYAVPDPVPRAYVVTGVRVAAGAAARDVLLAEDFDPRREVVLPEGTARPPGDGPPGQARILDLRGDRVRLEAAVDRPAYLVLVDTWAKGWRATVDGVETPLLRANVGFRAVLLPPGRHRVEMVYRPRAVFVGLALSAATLPLLAVGLFLSRLRSEGPAWRRRPAVLN